MRNLRRMCEATMKDRIGNQRLGRVTTGMPVYIQITEKRLKMYREKSVSYRVSRKKVERVTQDNMDGHIRKTRAFECR